MTKIVVRAERGALWPVDPFSEDVVRGMPGTDAMAKITQPRNTKQAKFIHALLHKIAENHPTLTTLEAVKLHLKLKSGMFDPLVTQSGRVIYVPKSTSFESMDQSEFSAVWDQWRKIIVSDLLPGITSEGLINEVLEAL